MAGGDIYMNYLCHTSVLSTGILFTWDNRRFRHIKGGWLKNKHWKAKHIVSGKVLPAAKWNLKYMTTFGTLPYMTTLVGVCGWSGQINNLSNLRLFSAFLPTDRIFWPISTFYMSKRGKECVFTKCSWRYTHFGIRRAKICELLPLASQI